MNNKSFLSQRKKEPEKETLYIVGTPIGNLNDISQRALNILKNVSLVACEDTRQTKKIMNNFNICNRLISFSRFSSFEFRNIHSLLYIKNLFHSFLIFIFWRSDLILSKS